MAKNQSPKQASKRRRKRVRAAGLTGVTLGASLLAAGGTALALSNKRTAKLARKARNQIPEPAAALQLASTYLPSFAERLANGNGVGNTAKTGKKAKKKTKARRN